MSTEKEYKRIQKTLKEYKRFNIKPEASLLKEYKELKKEILLKEQDEEASPEFKKLAEKVAKKYGFEIKKYKPSFNGSMSAVIEYYEVLVGNWVCAKAFSEKGAKIISQSLEKYHIEVLDGSQKVTIKKGSGDLYLKQKDLENML